VDINEALKELRAAVESGNTEDITNSFAAVDGWLSRGGFLPDDWEWNRYSPMIVVEQKEAQMIKDQFDAVSIRKLRVSVEGQAVKFKINEYMWSPPVGRVERPRY